MTTDASGQVIDLIFGRWRSQILAAGTELGVFDHLSRSSPRSAPDLAAEMGLDGRLLYRLLRAQAAIGLLDHDASDRFSLTASGDLLRAGHPQSLAAMARLEEGPQHYALWKHLPAMVRDGRQNAFMREFGRMAFDHARTDPDYGERFDQAMTSYSVAQAAQVLEALRAADLSGLATFCDVAGGRGYMACAMIEAYPHLSAIVLDLPEVVSERDKLWAHQRGLADRCTYVAGDMFKTIPRADAYGLKMILHDWNDEECVEILRVIRRSAAGPARLFIMEHIVPAPAISHFAKLFDVHMMCWGTGQERTAAEYGALLETAGWSTVATREAPGAVMGVIEAACA